MQSLKVGHYTNTQDATGLTVFLFDVPAVAAYHLCGSSPATRELHMLDFEANNSEINGLVFTGGSAFGLGAVDGVMRFLNEKGCGKRMPHGGVVPIVPAASIYDLAMGNFAMPTADDAYQACVIAQEDNTETGCIGAGTGATVGKLVPGASRMSGGFGFSNIALGNGLCVAAYALVNAVGDVRDSSGQIIAGARLQHGAFANTEEFLLEGGNEAYAASANTTLVAVFTNARFNKIELKRIAKMATAGMARTISPVFTRYDGDIVFTSSMGELNASELTVGTLAVNAVQRAIINAVIQK